MSKQTFTRRRGNRWCTLEIELKDGRLSICGSEGRTQSRAASKREALEYWRGYFEENPAEIMSMNQRFDKRFTSATGAARFVLSVDGEFHGLDVVGPDGGATLDILESCGQIRESLADWFPEVVPYLKWHLNDVHAECEHQETRGETWATHLNAVCGDCGYRLGSAWTKRELPAEVVAWVEAFPGNLIAARVAAAGATGTAAK